MLSNSRYHIIKVSTHQQLDHARHFINQKYKRCGTTPHLPETLFICYEGSKVVAAVGFDNWNPKAPNSLAYCFDYQHHDSDLQNETVEFCRWSAENSLLAASVAFIASSEAAVQGKKTGICALKHPVNEHARSFGLNLKEIVNARIVADKVPLVDHSYFLSEPAPLLYRVKIPQMNWAFGQTAIPAIMQGLISLEGVAGIALA